jgi:NADPH:quinone reductase-like Zn-dependent oxidoreductase
MQSHDPIPLAMTGVQLVGHGGVDKLVYRTDIPTPVPGPGEVLIRVAAAAVNNTDINTRIGWYSKSVTGATWELAGKGATDDSADASWSGGPLGFPRIQGADACGRIVAVGEGVDGARIGERVIVRNMLRTYVDWAPYQCWTFGSECDGGFAQYAKAPSREVYAIDSDWTDVELATIPCAYSTAENLLHRAGVRAGEHVLIAGASGGVGSAAVQLAKRRGARITTIAASSKTAGLLELGADRVVPRGASLVASLGAESVDVVVDVAAGPTFPELLDVLRKGGRYAVAGAIAGPLVELDVRTLYLKDLTFLGCTFQEDEVFENLVGYVERGEIKPRIGRTYALADIGRAQEDFLAKSITGKLVLVIPD